MQPAYLILDTSGPWQLRSGKQGKWIQSILHIAYCIVAAGAMHCNGQWWSFLEPAQHFSTFFWFVICVIMSLHQRISYLPTNNAKYLYQNVRDTKYNDLLIQKLICGFGHDGPKLINICKCSKFWSVSIKFYFITVLNFGKCVQF